MISAIPMASSAGIGSVELRASLRERVLAARPPTLTQGQLDVLAQMAGDFSARQWAQLWGVSILEIERAVYWLGVQCQGGT